MRFYFFLIFVVICIVVAACSHKPTRVSEEDSTVLARAYLFEKKSRPIQITPETVVLDPRSFFEYQLYTVPGAIHIDPHEFSLREWHNKHDGSEETQTIQMARRLALLGISPMIHVVILGHGDAGSGIEGEVALALMAMGVERVQLSTMDGLKEFRRRGEAPVHANQRPWAPRNVNGIFCSLTPEKSEGAIINLGKSAPSAAISALKLPVLKKDWKEFVNKNDLAPNARIQADLEKAKFADSSELMVMGIQAPIAVFSLLQLGFSRACLIAE